MQMLWFALLGFSILITLLWPLIAAVGWSAIRKIPRLEDQPASLPGTWPRLSVVVTACNEAAGIAKALPTLLAQDYPNLQVVAVNDRSSDETGAVLNKLAQNHARLQVIHIEVLPEGWLGKVHALQRATEVADGELLLFTDADIHFGQGALRQAVRQMQCLELDHLAVLPLLQGGTLAVRMMCANFLASGVLGFHLDSKGLIRGRRYIGVGAFNMVRASSLAKTPGFSWLRMEVVDDMALAMLIKTFGGRSAVLNGTSQVRVDWYPHVGAMARGLEKNLFGAVAHYRFAHVLPLSLFGLFALASPWLLLCLAAQMPWLVPVVFIHFALPWVIGWRQYPRLGLNAWFVLFHAPCTFLFLLLFLRSAWCCLRKQGIEWRGTFYPLRDLRQGHRLRFFHDKHPPLGS